MDTTLSSILFFFLLSLAYIKSLKEIILFNNKFK